MKSGPNRIADSAAVVAAVAVLAAADGVLAAVVVAAGANRAGKLASASPVFQKGAQTVAAAGMPQVPQRLSFDLPDALARYGEVLPHLFERVLAPIFQAKSHLDDFLLARRQGLEHLRSLFAQIEIDDRVGGRDAVVIHDEIAQMRLFLFANRRLQCAGLLGTPDRCARFGHRDV